MSIRHSAVICLDGWMDGEVLTVKSRAEISSLVRTVGKVMGITLASVWMYASEWINKCL